MKISISTVLSVIFLTTLITLKIIGAVTWSWWYVILAPIIIDIAYSLIFFLDFLYYKNKIDNINEIIEDTLNN